MLGVSENVLCCFSHFVVLKNFSSLSSKSVRRNDHLIFFKMTQANISSFDNLFKIKEILLSPYGILLMTIGV